MAAAGNQWGVVLAMLAGEVPPVPPATGAARQRHMDSFSPAVEKQMARVFGAAPDDETPKLVPKRPRCTAAGIVSAA
jgi:hypothetical protein